MLKELGGHLSQHGEGESVGQDHGVSDLVLDDGPYCVTAKHTTYISSGLCVQHVVCVYIHG